MFFRKNKTVSDVNVAKDTASSDVVVNAARTFNKTSKKKNTYVIQMENLFAQPALFEWCRETPLVVVRKNGVETQNTRSGFLSATPFPNPAAHDMVVAFKNLKPVMKETASTIIEYLDKETGAPVAQIFPTMTYIMDGFENNWRERLNHASRRDFDFQVAKRQKMLAEYARANNR